MARLTKLGLHLSTKAGLVDALRRADALSTSVAQVFLGSPRAWRVSGLYDQAAVTDVDQVATAAGVEWYVHLPYLINLASPETDQFERSRQALMDYCATAERLGAAGTVLHVGSHRGAGFPAVKARLVSALTEAAASLTSCRLLLENAAGQRQAVGSALPELFELVEAVSNDRLGLCLDTAHLMGAGIEFRTPQALDKLLRELELNVGLDRLGLIHLNDSKRGLGSGRDLHQNIGQGTVGVDGFVPILRSPTLDHVPAVLEVPGTDGSGPDEANLAVAQAIARGERPAVVSTAEEQLTLKF